MNVTNYRHGYRPDIDGLRAVAVVSVLLFHADIHPFWGGFVGVDVFFVISGYLITRNIMRDLERGSFSFSQFFIRRARRLLPASFVVIALTIAAGYIFMAGSMLSNLGQSAIFALFSISNFFFWRDVGYFATAAEYRPLLHTWSLGVEEQFYLIYPAFLVAMTALLTTTTSRIIAIGIGIVGASLAAQYVVTQTNSSAAFYLMPFRAGEFGLGILVALLPLERSYTPRVMNTLFAFGAALVAYSVLFFSTKTPFPGFSALVPCLGAALMIFSGKTSFLAAPLRNPFVVYIGVISYSLYLVHWPVLSFTKYVSGYPLALEQRLVLIVVSFALAYLLYKCVERPMRLGTPNVIWQRARQGIYALAVMFIACQLVAFAAWNQLGEELRFSKATLNDIRAADAGPGGECEPSFTPERRDGTRCVTTNGPNAKTALLLGESHAQHWRPALASVLPELGYSLDHFQGCAPIPNTTKFMDGKEVGACARYTSQLLDMVDDYDLIILAARWSLYTETSIGAHEKGTEAKSYVLSDLNGSPLTPDGAKTVFRNEFARFIEALEKKNKPVLVFGQVPELGIDLSACIALRDLGQPVSGEDCRPYYDRKAAMARLEFTNSEIARAVAGRKTIKAFWPTEHLCPLGEKYCHTRKDGIWLYNDDDHLNTYGALALAHHVRASIEALIAR